MIEVFVVLLIGSILIVILNKMPEKGTKVSKQTKNINKFFEAFHKTSEKETEKTGQRDVKEYSKVNEAQRQDSKPEISEREKLIQEAEILLKANKLKEAEGKYIDVLRIDEHDVAGYKGLGNICFIKKNYNDAEDIFEKLTKIVPKDSSNYCNLGKCCYKKNEFLKAIENYKNALKIEKNPLYYKNFGITLLKLKKYNEALKNLLLSLEKNRKDKETFNLAVSILDEIKDKKKQKEVAKTLIKINPTNSILKGFLKK